VDINDYITKTQQFTPARPDGMPIIDRTAQASFGLEMARRSAQQNQQSPPEPARMPPIIPVAN
jgi:hypothetical protein